MQGIEVDPVVKEEHEMVWPGWNSNSAYKKEKKRRGTTQVRYMNEI